MEDDRTYTAFAGDDQLASGDKTTILRATKSRLDQDPNSFLVVFDDHTGRQVDFDLRGSVDDVLAREAPPAQQGPGRPRLGVVSREVTLLPRHWEWLAEQPNGASAALRRLVDEARKREGPRERARQAAAVTGRVMTVLAGDLPDFEEAYRALDAGDRDRFEILVESWPPSVREYFMRLAQDAFTK